MVKDIYKFYVNLFVQITFRSKLLQLTVMTLISNVSEELFIIPVLVKLPKTQ